MEKREENYRIFTWLICIVISLAVIYTILISSFEIVAYGSMDYYQKEYEKYDVAEALNMEMEDIMYVTEEMMSFLRGDREDLVVETVVGGVEQEFFNESEISHMVDVQKLFMGGLDGRLFCITLFVALYFVLFFLKMDWQYIMPRAFQGTTAVFVVIAGILGGLFATDFYKYFEIFHKIFFEGDTWLFDPNTSLMINMLPEGLFYDMTQRIVAVFLIILGIVFVISVVQRVISDRNRRKQN